jgi:hypothetical protein
MGKELDMPKLRGRSLVVKVRPSGAGSDDGGAFADEAEGGDRYAGGDSKEAALGAVHLGPGVLLQIAIRVLTKPVFEQDRLLRGEAEEDFNVVGVGDQGWRFGLFGSLLGHNQRADPARGS